MAQKLFQQTILKDPSHARALAALGRGHAALGNWETADPLVREALAGAPDDPVVVLDAGRAYAIRAGAEPDDDAVKRAGETLAHAAEVAPMEPEAHAALARFYETRGEAPERIIAAYRRARELGEWSPELDVELAAQLMAVGRNDAAKALLVAVAADVHGGDTADEARRLLKSLGSDGGERETAN
jgi:Flp pilus assembly protein TadD